MPSFDIVSEVDTQELDNAINQARKELATRFDFKGVTAEILAEKDKITLTAQDAAYLRGLREILVGKVSRCKASYRIDKFASREKRKTICKPSFNLCVAATLMSPPISRISGTDLLVVKIHPPCTGGMIEISSPGFSLWPRSTNSTPAPIKMLLSCGRSAGCFA